MDIQLVWKGVRCERPLSHVDARRTVPFDVAGCQPTADYNTSHAARFAAFLETQTLSDVNFVAAHGGFIRALVRHLGGSLSFRTIKRNNLFIVGVSMPQGERVYLIRHCARQWQKGSGSWLGWLFERTTPDPQCARFDGAICSETAFRAQIRSILAAESAARRGKPTVRVYSSCMRRALETAEVVRDVVGTPEPVRVLPFAREETNFLGPFDVLNSCKATTMTRVESARDCGGSSNSRKLDGGGGSVATRLDPELWERAKRRACTKAKLCRHSARKMQWAVRDYKKQGGKYRYAKRDDNRLVLWGKEKWRTRDGTPSRGTTRYLPEAAWDELTPAQKRRADRTKAQGQREGRQYVGNPPAAKRAARRARKASGKRRS